MPINIEIKPVIVNKQSSFIEEVNATAGMKNGKKIMLKIVELAKTITEISLEAIQGSAKE